MCHDVTGRQGAFSSPRAAIKIAIDHTWYLQAHGDSSGNRAHSEQLFDRWRSLLGPDHPDTLAAAINLTLALRPVSDAESARVLGQDTLQRCRRVLGPDHPTTLDAADALTVALVQLGDAGAA